MKKLHILGLLGAVTLSCWASAQSDGIVWVGAKVDPIEGATLDNVNLAIKDGRIVSLGKDQPSGFKVLEGKGLWIVPGFIDAAMNRGLKLPEPPQNPARDDNTTAPAAMRPLNRKGIRPELRAADCLDLKLTLPTAYACGITHALMLPSGGTLRGQGAVVALDEGAADVVVIRNEFGQGASFSPGAGAGFPSTAFGSIALFRQTMLDAERYQLTLAANRPKELEPLGSLASILRGEQPLVWAADAAREVLRAVNLSREFRAKLIVLGGREAWVHADALRAGNIPVIANLAIGSEPRPSTDPDNEFPVPYLDELKANWRENAANVLKLHRAGVSIAFTTQGDGPGDFLSNVREIVKLGLPEPVAMRALTLGAAEILGVQDQIGSIKPGKRACLAIFDGNPMDSKSKVKAVVVNGKVVEVKE